MKNLFLALFFCSIAGTAFSISIVYEKATKDIVDVGSSNVSRFSSDVYGFADVKAIPNMNEDIHARQYFKYNASTNKIDRKSVEEIAAIKKVYDDQIKIDRITKLNQKILALRDIINQTTDPDLLISYNASTTTWGNQIKAIQGQ